MLTSFCSFKARQQYHVIAVVVIMLPAIHGVQHYQDESRTCVNTIVQGQDKHYCRRVNSDQHLKTPSQSCCAVRSAYKNIATKRTSMVAGAGETDSDLVWAQLAEKLVIYKIRAF